MLQTHSKTCELEKCDSRRPEQ